MRAHYLQHVPFEGLGSIKPWLAAAGYEITRTRLFAGEGHPSPNEVDFLTVMGGPMSVNDERTYPWLAGEMQFLRDFIETGRPLLGICLGAQLIASALGCSVHPNRDKEIGWFPVEGIPPGDAAAFAFPRSTEVFHWHGETFDLPPGALHLARSEACENQAFQLGRSVIGLQFHIETTPEAARALVENCRSELVAGSHVQTAEAILAATPQKYSVINNLMADLLAYLTASR